MIGHIRDLQNKLVTLSSEQEYSQFLILKIRESVDELVFMFHTPVKTFDCFLDFLVKYDSFGGFDERYCLMHKAVVALLR